jgi:hypothetical protein
MLSFDIFEWMTEAEQKCSATRLVGGCLVWIWLVGVAIYGLVSDPELAMYLLGCPVIVGMGLGGIYWISASTMNRFYKALLGMASICIPMLAMIMDPMHHLDTSSVLCTVAVAVVIGTVPFLIRFFNFNVQYIHPQEPVNLTSIRDRLQCFDTYLTRALCFIATATVAILAWILVMSILEENTDREHIQERDGVDDSSLFTGNRVIILLTCAVAFAILWMIVVFRRSFQTRRTTMNAPKPLRELLIAQIEDEEEIYIATDDALSGDNGTGDVLLVV